MWIETQKGTLEGSQHRYKSNRRTIRYSDRKQRLDNEGEYSTAVLLVYGTADYVKGPSM
jgi:hypothetical protein